MKMNQGKSVWVVVEAQSGIPVLAEVFADRVLAEKREKSLRRKMRECYDVVELFEEKIVAGRT